MQNDSLNYPNQFDLKDSFSIDCESKPRDNCEIYSNM